MVNKKLGIGLAVALGCLASTHAASITLDFNDLGNGPMASYGGFQWTGFSSGDAATVPLGSSGIFGGRAAYTTEAIASIADGEFLFLGAYITSAHAGEMIVYVDGYDANNALVGNMELYYPAANEGGWVTSAFYTPLSQLVFTVLHDGVGSGTFVLDDFTYESLNQPAGPQPAVPETGSVAVLVSLAGLALGLARRRLSQV